MINVKLNPSRGGGVDTSPLSSNGWLAGLIDADGSFYFNWSTGKKGLPNSPQYYMRISLKQDHHRENNWFITSFYNIMLRISIFIFTPLRSRSRNRTNKNGLLPGGRG